MHMEKRVIAILSHPDDVEFMCAGTLSLFRKQGWEVYIATMTPGDKGSTVHTREEISEIRTEEARKSAEIIGASYHLVGLEDVYVLYDRESINKTTALIRKIRPSIVITSSPVDYMVDHEITAKIVQTACFACGIKNMEVDEPAFEPTPYLYYVDAMEGKDKFGKLLDPSMYVDITSEIFVKEEMLKAHASQREWLLAHHNVDEYVISMRDFAEVRGKEAGVKYAEGFRQHLGHGFRQENVLAEILKENAIIKK